MEVTPACYSHLLSPLLGLAGGKVAVILEGGYCLKSLAEGAAITLKTLLGDPCPKLEPLQEPSDCMRDTILNCMTALRPFWRNLNVNAEYSESELNNTNPQNDMHKVVVQFEEQQPQPTPQKFATRDCYPIPNEAFIRSTSDRLDRLRLCTNLTYAPNRVCYVYDELMKGHFNLFEAHPERPERIGRMAEVFEEFELFHRMKKLRTRSATREELESGGHTGEHVALMRAIQGKTQEFREAGDHYNSVFFNEKTYDCARMAAGSILEVVDEVLGGQSRSGVCIVRPPGHHAESDMPHGFCVFNNVAVAANYAKEVHGVKRVLILDWDIHHGNGTQHMFEADPTVLYISLHRYDYANFFPKSEDANYTAVGTGRGEGFNVNIPWNRRAMGNAEYVMAFQQAVLPIAYEFDPELVLVSAGFDAAIGDPLGGYKVTPEAYGLFTHWMASLAEGKVVVCLEGGYNVNSIAYSMAMCGKALLGDPVPRLDGGVGIKQPSAVETIQNVLSVQRKYWKSLKCSEKRLPSGEATDQLMDKFSNMGVREEVGHNDSTASSGGGGGSATGEQHAEAGCSHSRPGEVPTADKMFAVYPKSDCPHLKHLDNDRNIESE